jgi:sodium/potassium-transporting ATPase subunit beta
MADGTKKMGYPPNRGPPTTGFKEFLYDPDTGAVMGRTGVSWAKIIIFYLVFYAALAAFFLLNFYIFYLTLNMDQPKYLMSDGLIGSNPGVGFRPMPDPDTSADSTLIWFRRHDDNKDDRTGYKFWTQQLEKFIDEIETGKSQDGSQNLQSCSFENGNSANELKACQVDITGFKDCNKNNEFGYRLGEPCILIKLNKIYGWTPEPYGIDKNDRYSDQLLIDDLDEEVKEKGMPEELKHYILNYTNSIKDESIKRRVLRTVWISCDGENVADTENIGPIQYYPFRGIAGYYFPFQKQQGYQPPFIFVQLKRPMPGVLINIQCNAFAKNVKPDKIARLASTHFELLID